MNGGKISQYSNLDEFSILVDKLVKSADVALHLSENEKCIIAECAFNGMHKVLNNRYKRTLNKTRIHKLEV